MLCVKKEQAGLYKRLHTLLERRDREVLRSQRRAWPRKETRIVQVLTVDDLGFSPHRKPSRPSATVPT